MLTRRDDRPPSGAKKRRALGHRPGHQLQATGAELQPQPLPVRVHRMHGDAKTIGNLLTGQALANERKDLGFPRRFCFRNARAARRPLPSGSARSRSRRSAAAERLMIAIHSRSQSHTTEELGVALPPVLHDRSKTIRAGGHRLPVPRITGCSWDTHERVAFPPRPNPPRGCSPDGPARCRDRVDAAAGPPA